MNILIYIAIGFIVGLMFGFYLVTKEKQKIESSPIGQEAINVIDQVVENEAPKVISSVVDTVKKENN